MFLRKLGCLLGWHSWAELPYRKTDWWLCSDNNTTKAYRIVFKECEICQQTKHIHTDIPVYHE